jgi:hypothetical protein
MQLWCSKFSIQTFMHAHFINKPILFSGKLPDYINRLMCLSANKIWSIMKYACINVFTHNFKCYSVQHKFLTIPLLQKRQTLTWMLLAVFVPHTGNYMHQMRDNGFRKPQAIISTSLRQFFVKIVIWCQWWVPSTPCTWAVVLGVVLGNWYWPESGAVPGYCPPPIGSRACIPVDCEVKERNKHFPSNDLTVWQGRGSHWGEIIVGQWPCTPNKAAQAVPVVPPRWCLNLAKKQYSNQVPNDHLHFFFSVLHIFLFCM